MRKRRSRIKILSVFFMIIAACIIVAFVIPIISAKKYISNADSHLKNRDNAFSEVTFMTHDQRGKEVSLTSDKILENTKDNFTFKNVAVTFTMPNGENGTISADTANAVRSDKTICELIGNVELKTDAGLLIKTERSFIDSNQKIATGNSDIVITRKDIKASSKKYFLDINKNLLILIDNVKGSLKTDYITSDKMIMYFDKEHEKSAKSLEAIGNASYISTNYHLKARQSIKYYDNNIEANDHVVLLYKKNGNDYDIKADHMHALLDKLGTINDVIATGSLIIKTKNATIRAYRGVFKNEKITVYGDVLISGDQGDIFGDTAILDVNTGNVAVNNFSGVINDGKRNQ